MIKPENADGLNKVILIQMPFGIANMPSLGISVLKSQLRQRQIHADLAYFSLQFTRIVGVELYHKISQGAFGFVGEWIFRGCMGDPPTKEEIDVFWNEEFPTKQVSEYDGDFESFRFQIQGLQKQANNFINKCFEAYDWSEYSVVGFSCLFQQDLASISLAKKIKENAPNTLIMFGGPNCEGVMGYGLLKQYNFIDYVFSGESDQNFPDVLDEVFTGQPVLPRDGLIMRDSETGKAKRPDKWVSPVQDLDTTAIPDYSDYFDQLGDLEQQVRIHLCFETARGCWWGAKHHCTFCGLNGSTMAFRSKSPKRAILELEYMMDTYGKDHQITLLRSVDQIMDMQYFKEFVPMLAEMNLDTSIYYETKSNLTRDQIQALAQANVTLLQPGIESLNSSVLKLMKKGCTMLQNIQFLKLCAENGVLALWNLLYGFPGENPSDYDEMAAIIPSLTHLQPPTNIYLIRLVRFSPYYNEPEEYGIENIRPYKVYESLYPDATDEVLAERAFRFDFDFADGRDLSYCRSTIEATRAWMNAKGRGSLIGFAQEDGLLIWDERPVAQSTWTLLDEDHSMLLRYCEDIRRKGNLKTWFEREKGTTVVDHIFEHMLQTLISRKLLVHEEDSFLSLVVLKLVESDLQPSKSQIERVGSASLELTG